MSPRIRNLKVVKASVKLTKKIEAEERLLEREFWGRLQK